MMLFKPVIFSFVLATGLALPSERADCATNADCLKRGLPLRPPTLGRGLNRRVDNLSGTYSPTTNVSTVTIVADTPGTYSFTVQGASGGQGAAGATGGFGAQLVRTLTIKAGDSVTLVPGAQGLSHPRGSDGGGGGGGASWVYLKGVLQVVAGGGGGGGDTPSPESTPGSIWIGGNGKSASLSPSGTSDGASYVAAASGGNGGGSDTAAGEAGGGGGGFSGPGAGQSGKYTGAGGNGPTGGYLGGQGSPEGAAGGYGGGGGGGYFIGCVGII